MNSYRNSSNVGFEPKVHIADTVKTYLLNGSDVFQPMKVLIIHDQNGDQKMSLFHILTGLECPACKASLPFSTISVLLGDETISVPLGTVKCLKCKKEIKAKGNRWDHFIRLAAIYVLPAFVVFHIWGAGYAFALNIVLLPFPLRFVGIERA